MAVTRSCGDSRKELENYFQSEEFDSIINKTLTVQFEKFITFKHASDNDEGCCIGRGTRYSTKYN